MAKGRRYSRDNRGRFASAGTGATARGGRLRTASGGKRKTQKIAVLSGDRMSSVPKGTIGRTRKQREITMIDRPLSQRQAYNEGRAKQMAAIAARKAPKASAPGRISAGRQKSTIRNTTGQSKTLNKFNSRPVGTMVLGRGEKLVPSPTRVPLKVAGPGAKSSDQAFARVATKAARSRVASARRKAPAAQVRVAPKVHPRIANRSAADQAHRDKVAKQWKTVEKPARRAVASMRTTRKAAAGLPLVYPRLSRLRKIGGDSRFLRENVMDQVNLLMRSPSRGKNKLIPQQRAQAVSDAVYTARKLRARAAMTIPRRSALRVRGARMGGTIAKPKGLAKRRSSPPQPRGRKAKP